MMEVMAWKEFLHPQIEEVLLQKVDPTSIVQITGGMKLADSAIKFTVLDQGRPVAVALCAPDSHLDCVGPATRSSVQCKQLLGTPLGTHILSPLAADELEGLSWAIYPYCTPLSDSRLLWPLQRKFLRQSVFEWLLDVAKETVCDVSPSEKESCFLQPLEYMASLSSLPKPIQQAAKVSCHTLETGAFSPNFCLMQGDFWKGNLLIDNRFVTAPQGASWSKRFVIIDWAGAQIKGYPFYDLIRFADSFRVKGVKLVECIHLLCQELGCTVTQGRSYLLAALGNIGMNLECFPFEEFLSLVENCYNTMEQVKL